MGRKEKWTTSSKWNNSGGLNCKVFLCLRSFLNPEELSLLAISTHLSAPLFYFCRYERVTDDREDDAAERADSSCGAQYQSTTLRVLTHFVAESGEVRGATDGDGLGQQNFLLGSDWQVEVTQLVKEFLRVQDPKVAQLLEGQVLIGLGAGTTKLQVVCVFCVDIIGLHPHFFNSYFSLLVLVMSSLRVNLSVRAANT